MPHMPACRGLPVLGWHVVQELPCASCVFEACGHMCCGLHVSVTQRGRQAGRQAAASEGRLSGGSSGGGSQRRGGRPSRGLEPAAASPHRGPGVCGQALPLRPSTGSPWDTPPSSAFLFHLLLSILLSFLPISPPHLPPSRPLWVSQPSVLPSPPLPGSPRPQHAFPVGAEGLRTPGPCLNQGRAQAPGGRGEGGGPLPQQALPSPTSPDGRLPFLHPVLAPCGPPRPARLGEGAGALSRASFPLPRLCLCPHFHFHLPLLLSSLLPLHLLLPPLLAPLLSSIFSFPLPPLPGPPSPLPPVLPPCSCGATVLD
ncbi:vegetative cell wall protein gp1-like isoform X2 [Rhinopithecus roxellana]|uniref:vegetative cell wall protein gp1-like isoform X2 n=1 Tax=Rhinopithecus roxellana TaxID=61622 RepID=UPI00123751D1|nr:vegetative cell wall protein gp1-like isoform X2 [Rhinopithecus roxellana]